MKYLKKFNETNEYDSFKSSDAYILPNVSFVVNANTVMFSPARKADITFSYDVGESDGWGMNVTWTPYEFTVPAGTTFGEAIEMVDENGWYVLGPPMDCDDC